MYNIIGSIVGAAIAIVFSGFVALKIGAPPLIIIVAAGLGLMVYSFYEDIRNDQEVVRRRKRKDAAQ